jgi:transaldolase
MTCSAGMIESGELQSRISAGDIRGMTSNPTIFEQAIAGKESYTADLRRMAQAGWSAARVLDNLMLDDIRAAADLFRPLSESTGAGDGYVSLEVHPTLANDTESTLVEARRLWTALGRPNVMIKIPATAAGIPAIRRAIAEGININITLIFSLVRYAEVIEAYLLGMEERLQRGLDPQPRWRRSLSHASTRPSMT